MPADIQRVIALDQALTVSGVAGTTDLCRSSRWSTTVAMDAKLPRVARLRAFGRYLNGLIREHAPQLITYEAPATFSRAGSSPGTTMAMVGIATVVELVAHQNGIPVWAQNTSDLKTWALGVRAPRKIMIQRAERELAAEGRSPQQIEGSRLKRAMMVAARDRGWTIRDHNEADAIWLLDRAATILIRGELQHIGPAMLRVA